jgi:hypothetical protein
MPSSDPVADMLLDAAVEVGSLHRCLLSGLRDLQSPQAPIRAGGELVTAKLLAAGPIHLWLLLKSLEQAALARSADDWDQLLDPAWSATTSPGSPRPEDKCG